MRFGGPGLWHGDRGGRKCHGPSWHWSTRPLWGGSTPPAGGKGPNPAQSCGVVRAPFGGGVLVAGHPLGALPPSLGGTRVCGPMCPPVLRGSPRGDATAHAPDYSLPAYMGPAPTKTGAHAAVSRRPPPHGLLAPPLGGRSAAPVVRQENPTGTSLERSASGPAASPPPPQRGGGGSGTRGALCMEHGAPSPPVQKIGVGHQPVLPSPTRDCAGPLGASRGGAIGYGRRYPPGWVGCTLRGTRSQTEGPPRRSHARHLLRTWGPAPQTRWGRKALDP